MVRPRLHFLSACLVLVACSSEVVSPETSSGSSAGGSGGATSSSTQGGDTSSSTQGGAGGTATCTGGFIDVDDDGTPVHFTAYCGSLLGDVHPSGPVAVAPYGASTLVVYGCADTTLGSPLMSLMFQLPAFPGSDPKAGIIYDDPMSTTWVSLGPGSVTAIVDVFEDVGGVVDGSFTGEVSTSATSKKLSGTFHVCRVP